MQDENVWLAQDRVLAEMGGRGRPPPPTEGAGDSPTMINVPDEVKKEAEKRVPASKMPPVTSKGTKRKGTPKATDKPTSEKLSPEWWPVGYSKEMVDAMGFSEAITL